MARPTDTGVVRDDQLRVRVSAAEKQQAQAQRDQRGHSSDSSYLRALIESDGKALRKEKKRS